MSIVTIFSTFDWDKKKLGIKIVVGSKDDQAMQNVQQDMRWKEHMGHEASGKVLGLLLPMQKVVRIP